MNDHTSEREVVVRHLSERAPERYRVKLEKKTSSQGKTMYTWEIDVAGDDPHAVLARVRETNESLIQQFGS